VNDSDSDQEVNEPSLSIADDHRLTGRKRTSGTMLLNTKSFPGVGRYQPIAFLAFLLLGPPAGDKCWSRFALDAHLEAAPPRPRLSSGPRTHRVMGDAEVMSLEDLISPRKRAHKGSGLDCKEALLGDEESEAIRIFNAETTARAQRLEELKLALSLFPDDESIKAELKQFVDTQRRTSLAADTTSQQQQPQQPEQEQQQQEQVQFAASLPGMFC
jgi:hypothetical protein